MLQGKKIVVGVTGSIAAYKAAILVRLLIRAGAEVRVVMTPTAKAFITPLTLATLSKSPVPVEFFNPENGAWNSHVSLGEWADALLIAPATACTLAKMATGVADNLLTTVYLSAKCPVFVAPAMDLDMYAHPTTQYNLDSLKSYGNYVIEPDEGELASGLQGKGRMAEPEQIVATLTQFFDRQAHLSGKTVLVTAGPTIEPIDPVRFISNYSSGKMGYALAAELQQRGARVILLTGKCALTPPAGVQVLEVLTAEEMYHAACTAFKSCDGAVMCAAVADYTPQQVADAKIKKQEEAWTLTLRRTPDIAAALGEMKGDRLLVGFALETDHEQQNARLKLERKNMDFIVLNSLRDQGAGFGGDTNKVTLLCRNGDQTDFEMKSKREVASDIVDEMERVWHSKPQAAQS
ncbi:MAG: bifunctional phosphopantothenoylcysteine decarboxylase/phosphopantothenate--cysteine ligase CoaBC [Alistipes sp.]|nr:bifunctional phosphopantothenoylcysteine decarboxylase/phosphopantothenate--cysteine ligase CoaBC [Alistipes sp.]